MKPTQSTKDEVFSRKGLPWEKNGLRWTPNEGSFPMSYLEKPTLAFAALWTVLGLGAMALPARAAFLEWGDPNFAWSTLVMKGPFELAGFLLFLFGASRFYTRRQFTLRREEVECDRVSVFKREHWKESIRKYAGTLKEIKFYSGGRAGRARLFYQVILKHSDPRRSVVLFRCYSWRSVDEAWRRFAKLFNVAALEETPNGIAKISPRDLELRQTGQDLRGWVQPEKAKLSSRVRLTVNGGSFEFRFRNRFAAFPYVTIAVVVGAAAAWGAKPFGLAWPLGMSLPCFIALASAMSRLIGWEVVTLACAGVEHSRETPWGPRAISQLPAELVTQCSLRKEFFWLPPAVSFQAGGERLSFGAFLPKADREQIRDLGILVLSHGPSRLDLAS